MNDRRKAAIDALRGISSGETDDKEKRMYMEAIRILISPENEVQSDSFQCDKCNRNRVVNEENVCQAGCLTAEDCTKKFRPQKEKSERRRRKNAGNGNPRQ